MVTDCNRVGCSAKHFLMARGHSTAPCLCFPLLWCLQSKLNTVQRKLKHFPTWGPFYSVLKYTLVLQSPTPVQCLSLSPCNWDGGGFLPSFPEPGHGSMSLQEPLSLLAAATASSSQLQLFRLMFSEHPPTPTFCSLWRISYSHTGLPPLVIRVG